MKLVDTSSWIEQLRRDGDVRVRDRVEALLTTGQAAWCAVVELELWNGARGEHERTVLEHFGEEIPSLEITQSVWSDAMDLARSARDSGITVPVTDLLVAACAHRHGVEIEHNDNHFALIEKLLRV